jgi:hypothetical protein
MNLEPCNGGRQSAGSDAALKPHTGMTGRLKSEVGIGWNGLPARLNEPDHFDWLNHDNQGITNTRTDNNQPGA